MIGSLFAGTDESPGEKILFQGRTYKVYRGMGSIEAMREGSSDRYFQDKRPCPIPKWCPRALSAGCRIAARWRTACINWSAASRAGMGYVGCATIEELRTKPVFTRITAAGLRESHVHDVIITKEAPNYLD